MALTPLEVFFVAVPEMIATVLCCLALLRRPWRIGPVLTVAIPAALVAWLVRNINLPFGVHTILITVFLAALLVRVYRVNLRQGLIAAVLTVMLLAFCEIISGVVFVSVTGWTPEDFGASRLVRIVTGLPHILLLLAVALLIRSRCEGRWLRYVGLD